MPSKCDPLVLFDATKIEILQNNAFNGEDEVMEINTQKQIEYTIWCTSIAVRLVDPGKN
jgi:hypothetical protein